MAETQSDHTKPKVVVVQLSEAFGDVWGWVADELGDTATVVQSHNGLPPTSDVAIVLLSAGAAERDALEWLDTHTLPNDVPAIVVGIDYGRRLPAQVVKAGAADYYALPDDLPLIRSAIAAAVERTRNNGGQPRSAAPPAEPFEGIIAESEAMQRAFERARWLVRYADVPAMIVGERGTGKETLARAIHKAGARREAPFVAVDCAPTEETVRFNLFGQAEDTSSGSEAARPGLLEVAEGGTILLDNASKIPLAVQGELADVVRTGVMRRVGGGKEYSVNVRLIATCSEDPERLVERGELHRDFYSAMGVASLCLPALRERGDDVLLIAREFVRRIAREHALPEPSLSPEVEAFLQDRSWDGNLRELRTVLVRAALLSQPGGLSLSQLNAAVDMANDGSARASAAVSP